MKVEAVEPEEPRLQISVDEQKIVAMYRQENEQLRHDKMMLTVALQYTVDELQKLREDFDGIVAKLPQDHPKSVKRNNPKKKGGKK